VLKWITNLNAKLDRLLSRLPPDDSPTRDNLLCHLRKPDTPCRCVFWMEVTQRGADGQPDHLVKGCIRDMLPFMLNGAIRQANRAADQADAARQGVGKLAGLIESVEALGRVPQLANPSIASLFSSLSIHQRSALSRELPLVGPTEHLQVAGDVDLLADHGTVDEGANSQVGTPTDDGL
jgi:hypothetical protein